MSIFGIGFSFLLVIYGFHILFERTDKNSLEKIQQYTSQIEDMTKELERGHQTRVSSKISIKLKECLNEIKSMENGLMQSKAIRELEGLMSKLSEMEDNLEEETLENIRKSAFEIQ
ncbi:MAG: hypothetical protein ABEK36_05605 [Candidatus Aenigmatarchaeota archaeon]